MNLRKIICLLASHQWEISKMVTKGGKFKEFQRTCKRCGKMQYLGRSKKYHPTLYVWRDYSEGKCLTN